MRTLFIGGTRRGYLTLKALADSGADLVGVISMQQDDHEQERFEAPIADLARSLSIPCFETKWIKDKDYARLLSDELSTEIAFVVGCRAIIPRDLYEIPSRGTLAVHDSLLPLYRGFAPLNWAIINGDRYTGVTLFYLNESMDGGDIVAQKKVSIGPFDTAPDVYGRLCQATVDIVVQAYPALCSGTVRRRAQEFASATYTCSRTPLDGMLEWTDPTASIHNKIRALSSPYPGAYTYLNTKKLFIWRAKPVTDPPRYVGAIPGRVVHIDRETGQVDVLTGDGILRVESVQIEGEEPACAAAVLRSIRIRLGIRPEQILERLQNLEERFRHLELHD